MKCLKKRKNCEPILRLRDKGHFICSGINKKPTKYKKDIIKLCLKGKYVKRFIIEMTLQEALMISSALSLTVSKGVNNGTSSNSISTKTCKVIT